MTQFLLQTVGVTVLGLVVAWARARRARRTRGRYRTDGSTSFPARLAVEGERPRSGRVILTDGERVWTARPGDRQVRLTGAQLLSAASTRGWGARQGDVVLRLWLPAGGTVRVVLERSLAALLAEALSGPDDGTAASASPAPAPRRPGRGLWAWALVAAGLLFLGYAAVDSLTGYSTTATVVPGDTDPNDGSCPAVWDDPSGRSHRGEVDCDDEPAGTRLHELVGGWPDGGDPTLPSSYLGGGLLFGLPPVAVGTAWLLSVRRRRRAWAAETALAAGPHLPAAVEPLPPLTEQDVVAATGEQPSQVVDRLASYAARQQPRAGWSDPRRPNGVRAVVPLTRWTARLWAPVAGLLMALLIAWPWPVRWYELHTHGTTTVQGISTGSVPVDGDGPVPGELTVQFPLPDGGVQRADVTTSVQPVAGTPMTVVYATDAPRWARLAGDDDDLGIGTLVWGLVTVLLLVAAGWRVRPLLVGRLAIRRARTTRARPALGVLTADPAGRPLLLLTDPLVAPLRFTAVPLLQPLPLGTTAAVRPDVQLSVHGRLDDGRAIVVRVPGIDADLLPAAPATLLDPGDVVHLLDLAHVGGAGDERAEADAPAPEAAH